MVVIGSETNLPPDKVLSSPGSDSSTTDVSTGAGALTPLSRTTDAETGADNASLSPWRVGALDPASPSTQEIEDALSGGDGEK